MEEIGIHKFRKSSLKLHPLLNPCIKGILPTDKLVKKFRAKPVYIGGQLVYTVGMILMALTRSKYGPLFNQSFFIRFYFFR